MKTKVIVWGTYAVVMVIMLIIIFPILWLILLSLKTQAQAFTYPPVFIFKPYWKNYTILFSEEAKFYRYLTNSMIISSGSVLSWKLAQWLQLNEE